GFEIQKEKVQKVSPWKYLGLTISERTITLQTVHINDNPKTLHELHQLCGTINWVRPWLGITTQELAPLFNLLKGGEELSSPRQLTPEARDSIQKVQKAISERQAHRYVPSLPFQLILLGQIPYLHALIFQWDEVQRDRLIIIEWVFLLHHLPKSITTPQETMAKLVIKACSRLRSLSGCDFACIHFPLSNEALEHLMQTCEIIQIALADFPGKVSIHPPKHKLFNTNFKLVERSKQARQPLNALTLFTDGSGKTHKSVITWKNPLTSKWEMAELAAVVRAFQRFPEPFNLITDSAY
ncbi:POK18 protein, partial [Oriolus oriolus]|nr:POK18 protein [Oriolus oriolus]